jgi:DtxR family Mn-dependent transcriptional regulator
MLGDPKNKSSGSNRQADMDILSPSLENYLEAIFIIGLKKKAVRVKDIAKFLRLRAASVVGALQTLEDKGFIHHERYGYVELTAKGRDRAQEIYKKHEALTRFFHEVLGLDMEIAAEDACDIEHYIHEETVNRLVRFMEFIETCPLKDKAGIAEFRDFVDNGVRPQPRQGST